MKLWLGTLLGVGYLVGGIAGWIADVTEDGGDLAFWLIFLLGGGVLLLAGLLARGLPPAVSLALVIVGAAAGALALFWTVFVPLLALVLIVLAILEARRTA